MKIYTKTGDTGSTSLLGGQRVPKHHIRIESYGTVDELNAHIGMLRDQDILEADKLMLTNIQNHLFTIGSMLATSADKDLKRFSIPTINAEDVSMLENSIDQMNETLPQLAHFVLPGGHSVVSLCHIARTVCRRCERNVSFLNEVETVNPTILIYLNRLSDYLFVLSRKLCSHFNSEEIKWIPTK